MMITHVPGFQSCFRCVFLHNFVLAKSKPPAGDSEMEGLWPMREVGRLAADGPSLLAAMSSLSSVARGSSNGDGSVLRGGRHVAYASCVENL